MDKPEWWPECPYPEDIFPMKGERYAEIVPDPNVRTALSGCLGRLFWNIAADEIWRRWVETSEDAAQQVAEADRADGSHLVRVHEDDEIVGHDCSFHMERMDDDHIWFQVDGVSFDLDVKGGKLLWRPQINGGWPAVSALVGPAA